MRFISFVALTLFTTSASALDAGTLVANLKNRQLEPGTEGLEHIMCLMNSMDNVVGSVSMTIGLIGEAVGDGSISTICPNGIGDCDLSETDMAAEIAGSCDVMGGKIVEESIYLCKDMIEDVKDTILQLMGLTGVESEGYYGLIIDQLEAALDTVQQVKITGIPVCLALECSDEIDVTSTLATLIEAFASEMLTDADFDEVETATIDSILGLVTGFLSADECAPLSLADEDEMCIDSLARMSMNGKSKGCSWVGKKEKRCSRGVIASHCPKTCGACAEYECADSKKKFVLPNGKEKKCGWIGRKDKEARCLLPKVMETCRDTCGFCLVK